MMFCVYSVLYLVFIEVFVFFKFRLFLFSYIDRKILEDFFVGWFGLGENIFNKEG